MNRRLLLVGWDAAEWTMLHPLLDAGEMPALNRLVENGASGTLGSSEPACSALQWTSLLTGKRAWQHGIYHDHELADPDGKARILMTVTRRQAATVWEILARKGRQVLAVGWPATSRGQCPNAKIISDGFGWWSKPPPGTAWPPSSAGTFWPLELQPVFDPLRVPPAQVAADIVARYLPLWREVDQKNDHRLWYLRMALALDFTYHTAMAKLLRSGEWDFAAVRFPGLEFLRRIFDNRDPLQREAAKAHCRMLDQMLRNLVELAGAGAAVMVVSETTPRAKGAKSQDGILAAAGPGWAKDSLLHGASLLDVAPTILNWFGLPAGEDMDGRALEDIYAETTPVRHIESWEKDTSKNCQFDFSVKSLGGDTPAVLWHRQAASNLAQSYLDAGKSEEALPLLTALFQSFPELPETCGPLFQCQLAVGHLTAAEETLAVVLEAFPPGAPALVAKAELALAKRDLSTSRNLASQTLQQNPTAPAMVHRLGILLLRLREWTALAELAQGVLQRDETDPIAWLALAEAQLRQSHPIEAAASAQRAIGLSYSLADAHFVLARALVALGKWKEAWQVMETILNLQPEHRVAAHYFRRIKTSKP